MRLLSLDPSGNFNEGKGTTGWANYYNDQVTSVGQILAKTFSNRKDYWDAHIKLLESLQPEIVVLESYVLFQNTQKMQIGSEMETSQLIGIITHYCDTHGIKLILQHPKIQARYPRELLLKKGIISKKNNTYYAAGVIITRHILSAIKHAEFYIRFGRKKEKKQ